MFFSSYSRTILLALIGRRAHLANPNHMAEPHFGCPHPPLPDGHPTQLNRFCR